MTVQKMRKIICHRLFKGKDKFCVAATKFLVYSNDGKELAVFSDMKNILWAQFLNDDEIIVKNAAGIFKIYNILENRCVVSFKPYEKQMDSISDAAVDTENQLLYDIVAVASEDWRVGYSSWYIMVMDLKTGKRDFVQLPENGTAGLGVHFDSENGFQFIFNQEVPMETGSCWYKPVLAKLYADEVVFVETTWNESVSKYVFFEDCVLLPNKELCWIQSGKRIQLNIPDSDRGLLYRAHTVQRYLVLAFAKEVLIWDLIKNEKVFIYEDACISDAQIIGNDLYVCTWNHLVKIPNIFQEFPK